MTSLGGPSAATSLAVALALSSAVPTFAGTEDPAPIGPAGPAPAAIVDPEIRWTGGGEPPSSAAAVGSLRGPAGSGPTGRPHPMIAAPSELATFFGGSDLDAVHDVAVDETGAIYLAGRTRSVDFPATPGSMQDAPGCASCGDGFVAKLTPAGALDWATYLGGSGADVAYGLAVDANHRVYVVGATTSTDFPTAGLPFRSDFQGGFVGCPPYSGGRDGFLTVLDADGGDTSYSTYLGGAWDDFACDVALDPTGRVWVLGPTASDDWPFIGPTYQSTHDTSIGANYDFFLMELDSNVGGSWPVYGTYVGGSGEEGEYAHCSIDGTRPGALVVADDGTVFVAGWTTSFDLFKTAPGGFAPSAAGGLDGFLLHLDPSKLGSGALLYGTYLGGQRNDEAHGLTLADDGTVFVAGTTNSEDLPLSAGAYRSLLNGDGSTAVRDAFLVHLDTSLTGAASRLGATLLGGAGDDVGHDVAVDEWGAPYVVGGTDSSGFPVSWNGFDDVFDGDGCGSGEGDTFVMQLAPDLSARGYASLLGGTGPEPVDARLDETAVAVAPDGGVVVAGTTGSSDFPVTAGALDTTFGAADCGPADGFVARLDPEPWTDLGASLAGVMAAGRGPLLGGTPFTIDLTGGPPGATTILVLGFDELGVPFKGGTLVPELHVLLFLPLDAQGGRTDAFPWPAGLPSDFATTYQYWMPDPGGPFGWSASNALRARTP